MGDDAVIVEGVDSEEARASLYSTVHGAGRRFGRKEAKRRFTRAQMDAWLVERGVVLVGADLDESRWPTAACPTCSRTTRTRCACCTRCGRSRSRWRAKTISIRSRTSFV